MDLEERNSLYSDDELGSPKSEKKNNLSPFHTLFLDKEYKKLKKIADCLITNHVPKTNSHLKADIQKIDNLRENYRTITKLYYPVGQLISLLPVNAPSKTVRKNYADELYGLRKRLINDLKKIDDSSELYNFKYQTLARLNNQNFADKVWNFLFGSTLLFIFLVTASILIIHAGWLTGIAAIPYVGPVIAKALGVVLTFFAGLAEFQSLKFIADLTVGWQIALATITGGSSTGLLRDITHPGHLRKQVPWKQDDVLHSRKRSFKEIVRQAFPMRGASEWLEFASNSLWWVTAILKFLKLGLYALGEIGTRETSEFSSKYDPSDHQYTFTLNLNLTSKDVPLGSKIVKGLSSVLIELLLFRSTIKFFRPLFSVPFHAIRLFIVAPIASWFGPCFSKSDINLVDNSEKKIPGNEKEEISNENSSIDDNSEKDLFEEEKKKEEQEEEQEEQEEGEEEGLISDFSSVPSPTSC